MKKKSHPNRNGPRILSQRRPECKEKRKLQIDIHIVLKIYKYTKSLFLNTLKCNHLPKQKKKKNKKTKNNFFLILGWLGFLFFEVRVFIVVVLF